MRFSLGTFVLIILLISSAYAVVMLNAPWYLAEKAATLTVDEVRARWSDYDSSNDISPDGSRILRPIRGDHGDYLIHTYTGEPVLFIYGLFKNSENGPLIHSFENIHARGARFNSDSEILIIAPAKTSKGGKSWWELSDLNVFKRRYRESFFGYVARPEFLILLCVSIILAVKFARHFMKRKSV